MKTIYIDLDHAIDIYNRTIDISGGGANGVMKAGILESVLFHIQNDDYYPDFIDKLTHLFYSVCNFHCFEDGNKRIAISLTAHMLLINGYLFIVPTFIKKMENISYHVAAGLIDKELLKDIFIMILECKEDESVKLRIFQAISKEF